MNRCHAVKLCVALVVATQCIEARTTSFETILFCISNIFLQFLIEDLLSRFKSKGMGLGTPRP